METIKVGLIKGRHSLPVEEFIFNGEITFPLNMNELGNVISHFLETKVGIHEGASLGINQVPLYGEDTLCYWGDRNLVVYVTGLTACTAELVKYCMYYGVSLTLMHYDKEAEEYVPQVILRQKG